MAATAEHLRVTSAPNREADRFELVTVVCRAKPAALVECLDCGGTLTSGDGRGFLCTVCSSRWRSRLTPSAWWERLVLRLLPTRYRWLRYRIERA
jgi:hypothetical protein